MIQTANNKLERMTDDKSAKSTGNNPISLLKRLIPLFMIIGLLAAGYLFDLHKFLSLDALTSNKQAIDGFVRENFLMAASLYLFSYIVAVSLSFPGASLLTIAGGAIFGWAIGGTLAIFGATIGAAIIFLIAKTSLGDYLVEKAGPRMTKLLDGFQKDAFNYLLTIRLAPVVPFWITNLASAFVGMSIGRYVIATFLGIIPGGFAYAFIGQQLGSSFNKDSSLLTNVILGLAALAAASVIPLAVKWYRGRPS